MQLAILLVVVCALAGTSTDVAPLERLTWPIAASLGFLAAAPLTAILRHAALRRALRAGDLDRACSQQHLERWQSLVTWLWAGGSLAALYLAHWPDVVRHAEFTVVWPLADDLLILAPLLGSLALVWMLSHRTERLLEQAAQADGDSPIATLGQYLWLQTRQHLGLTLLPALIILGVQEGAWKLGLITGADDARAWWLCASLVFAAIFALPLALKWLWQTQCVADSPLKQRLLESCRRMGCPVRDIVVWRTGGKVANAAVAGLLPWLRTIFLSDALIARLDDDEIDVVVRHEAAHLAQRHLWQRLILLCLPALLYFAVQAHWPEALSELKYQLSSFGIAPSLQTSVMVPLAALIYALFAIGWLARLHEHDADLAACCAVDLDTVRQEGAAHELAISRHSIGQLHSALVKIVGDGDEYRRRRWLHPSVVQRTEFLLRLCHQPLLILSFRRRLLGLSWLLLSTCLAALAAGLWPRSW